MPSMLPDRTLCEELISWSYRGAAFLRATFTLRCGHWVQVPRVGAHLRREGVHATMFCSHWFITLFAYTLPFDHLLRVWDVLFLEGPKIIFRRETA